MTNKYDSPQGPPPSYGIGRISSPPPVHSAPSSDYYGASPYQQYATPYQGNGYPPQNEYPPQQGGYYNPGPQMGYAPQQGGFGPPQGGYYGQQPYGPQGGYYGRPQGQYMDGRGRSPGFMEAMLASLACCCCLDACLLF